MASTSDTHNALALPKLKYIFKTEAERGQFIFYDIKFYPYATPPNPAPVFAVVSQTKVYIGRLSAEDDAVVTMLHELEDEKGVGDASMGINSCSWCYINNQQPLLAIAGGSGQLRLVDAVAGELFATLVGHGHGDITDIATHPLLPWVVATASMDRSIRIWDLRRHDHRHESPTIVICGQASGHTEGLLTVSWHSSGRYLISGGHDQRVCVWAIPDLADGSSFWLEIGRDTRKRSSNEVKIIHFPHFTSSAVHHAFVDCVRFFGDLVVSRAAREGKIVLWKITGFDPRKPQPDAAVTPKTEEFLDTRNGFMRRTYRDKHGVEIIEVAPELADQPPYQRLLEFESPNSDTFYLRFALLLPSPDYPGLHPTIAFGNTASEIRFWDLERLSLGHSAGADDNKAPPGRRKKGVAARGGRLHLSAHANGLGEREVPSIKLELPSVKRESTVSSTSNMSSIPWSSRQTLATEATSVPSDEVLANGSDPPPFPIPNRKRYPIHDPHRPIRFHDKVTLTELQYKKQSGFTARAAAWSPCGRWCIVVGESSTGEEGWGGFAVLHR